MRQPLVIFGRAAGLAALGFAGALAAAEPSLPAGLGAPAAPRSAAEPALPMGLAAPAGAPARLAPLAGNLLPEGLSGFWEARGGTRLQSDPYEKTASIGETRLQIQYEKAGDRGMVLLIDSRYGERRYRELFPPHWSHARRVGSAEETAALLKAFWTLPAGAPDEKANGIPGFGETQPGR